MSSWVLKVLIIIKVNIQFSTYKYFKLYRIPTTTTTNNNKKKDYLLVVLLKGT